MLLWQALFKVKLEPHPIADRIPKTHTTRRLVVHYVFKERASRSFLAKRGESGDTLFQEMAVAIARELVNQDEQALWNAPIAGFDKVYGVRNDFFATLGRKHKVTPRKGKGMPFIPAMRLPQVARPASIGTGPAPCGADVRLEVRARPTRNAAPLGPHRRTD